MRIIYTNILKIGLLMMLSICMFGVVSKVEAAPKVVRTYYAYNGGTLDIIRLEKENYSTTIFNKNTNVVTNNSKVGEYKINSHKGTKYNITLPNNLEEHKKYYIVTDSGENTELYIMPEYMLSIEGMNGHEKIYSKNSSVKLYSMKESNARLQVYTKNERGGLQNQTITQLNNGGKVQKVSDTYSKGFSTRFYVEDGEEYVDVDKNGKITAKGVGTATIVFNRNIIGEHSGQKGLEFAESNLSSKIKIKVEKSALVLPEVVITDELSLEVNATKKIDAEIKNVSGVEIVWESNNKNVTVDNKGNVTGKKEGDAIITAKIKVSGKEYKDECKVTVTKKGNGQASKYTFDFKKGDKLEFTAKANTSWNLREKGKNENSTSGSKIIGQLKKGDMVEVTSVPTSGRWVGVKVLSGNLKDKTGDIFFDDNAKKNFAVTNEVPEAPSNPATPETPSNPTTPETPSSPEINIELPEADGSWIVNLINAIVQLIITLVQNIDWVSLANTTVEVTSGLITAVVGAIN